MSTASPPEAGRLLSFDAALRRAKGAPRDLRDDAGSRYEYAMQALLDVLDDEDTHLVDELDEAVARLLRGSHPSSLH